MLERLRPKFRKGVSLCQRLWPVSPQIARLPLKDNPAPLRPGDLASLASMLSPGGLFVGGLLFLFYLGHPNYGWLAHPDQYPWELWMIAFWGSLATVGGFGDWIYHRLFVAVGPEERKSHLLALATGGLPMAVLMMAASVASAPRQLLIPILLVLLYTTVLICYDEFVFHRRRCQRLETLFHRALVYGNGLAWLAWMHWLFVRTA